MKYKKYVVQNRNGMEKKEWVKWKINIKMRV